MSRSLFCAALAAAMIALPVHRTEAQARFAANLSWGDDTDLGIGGRAGLGLGRIDNRYPIEGFVSFDYFFPDDEGSGLDLSYFEINANAIIQFPVSSNSLGPYIGAGLNFARFSVGVPGFPRASDWEVGVNLLGGIRLNARGNVQPFVEGRFELAGGEQFVLAAGLSFGRP